MLEQTLTRAPSHVPRAVRLARQLIRERLVTREYLARELAVSPPTLDQYLTCTRLMPLERQLCLAGLIIAQMPHHKLDAYRLRDQVVALMERRLANTR